MAEMRKVKIEDAKLPELRQYADLVLGISLGSTAKVGTLLARIRAAQPSITEIEVDDEALSHEQPITVRDASEEEVGHERSRKVVTGKGTRDQGGRDDPQVRLLINESDKPGGKRSVYLGVNGVSILVPRGEVVTIAYRYYEALRNAVISHYDKDPEDDTNLIESKVPAYPFQVYEMPSRTEILAWVARTSGGAQKAA